MLRRKLLVVVSALTASLAGFAGASTVADAQPYDVGGVSMSIDHPAPGAQVQIHGAGFAPNSMVDIYFRSAPVLLVSVPADGAGVVLAVVQIPEDATGAHQIELVGVDSSGSPLSLSRTLTVAAGADANDAAGSLVSTGRSLEPLLLVAAVALVAGSVLIWRTRSKQRATGS